MTITIGIGEERRVVSLDGGSNLRDLGGYSADDGRTIRWGLVFRSANFAGLTEADAATVLALGLRTICDLRHDRERTERPTPAAILDACQVHHLDIHPREEHRVRDLVQGLATETDTPEAVMASIYRAFALEHAEVYARMLDRLLNDDGVPLLFHCTAGKDRTGFGAAVLLRALGVPMETVVADYLLTNIHWKGTGLLAGAPASLRAALGGAHAAYLEAAFAAIDERFGSFDAWLDAALGFGPDRVSALRDRLLEVPLAA